MPFLKNAFERAKNLTESTARRRAIKVAPKVAAPAPAPAPAPGMKSGGSVGKASKRADGIAKKGKTRGKFV